MKVCVDPNIYTNGFNDEQDVYEYLISNMPKEDKVLSQGDYCFNMNCEISHTYIVSRYKIERR